MASGAGSDKSHTVFTNSYRVYGGSAYGEGALHRVDEAATEID